jgi:uncharacterized protein
MESSAAGPRQAPSSNGQGRHAEWIEHTRVFLQPIAAPSILGLFGFAGSTFIVAANLAGWYGTSTSGQYLFPFALAFGGVAQFAAGMWAYRARDAIATAMHGTWGAFWIGYGVLQLLLATGTLAQPAGSFVELGYWFVALAIITGFGTIAALARSVALTAVLGTLTAGATLAAVFNLAGGTGWEHAAGYVLIVSAALAAYTAGAMMIAAAWGRPVLPVGELRAPDSVVRGPVVDALEYELGEPGVKRGQ